MESQKDTGIELDGKAPLRAWYVIHTYSGYENKVKANLERKIASQGLSDEIFNVVVPVEDELEEKDGKQKITKKKIFPGYVMVEMIVNNRSWYVVRNTQGVTGFVGSEKEPIPLTDAEAARILGSMELQEPKMPMPDLAVGDVVRIKSGWFEDYTATISSIDTEKMRLKVLVEETPVELDFTEVEKI
ncbi:MAG: transcription termination/antitermination factor NusG [Selenomonadaceae bacterium]|nr:transcription termination/antitermination factor NusG [Selenomonadaceae bacterium]